MTASIQQQEPFAALLIARWEQAYHKVMELAQAIPANQFDSRPLPGIRTFGEVLRHIAFWNRYVADTLNGRKADDAGNELPADQYPAKGGILEALKRSSADVSAKLREPRTAADPKTAELIMTFVEHTSEHYGQLAVYSRWIGIVPPASRT